jgi:hypothetical protein
MLVIIYSLLTGVLAGTILVERNWLLAVIESLNKAAAIAKKLG